MKEIYLNGPEGKIMKNSKRNAKLRRDLPSPSTPYKTTEQLIAHMKAIRSTGIGDELAKDGWL